MELFTSSFFMSPCLYSCAFHVLIFSIPFHSSFSIGAYLMLYSARLQHFNVFTKYFKNYLNEKQVSMLGTIQSYILLDVAKKLELGLCWMFSWLARDQPDLICLAQLALHQMKGMESSPHAWTAFLLVVFCTVLSMLSPLLSLLQKHVEEHALLQSQTQMRLWFIEQSICLTMVLVAIMYSRTTVRTLPSTAKRGFLWWMKEDLARAAKLHLS